MTAFEEFGVLPEIAKAVDDMEWTLPTDIQAEAIPLILGGGDVLLAAETGSGKTGAFSLPVIQIVWESLKDQETGKSGGKSGTSSAVAAKWQMNPYDRDPALAIGTDGVTCQARENSWHGTRCMKGVTNSGKYYYEVVVNDEGLCRIGWSTSQAVLDLGTDAHGFGFGGTGKKSNHRQFDTYGEPFGLKDVIGCFIDLDTMSIKFAKNGIDLGKAFTIPTSLHQETFYPSVVLKNAELEFNFGEKPLRYPPAEGYIAVFEASSKNVSTSSNRGQQQQASSKPARNAPLAIIIEPSRELADQTYRNIQLFKQHLDDPKISEVLLVGGVSAKEQSDRCQQGVHIVVGTPGRLDDFIQSGVISLSHVKFFILDEADGLLSQGNGDLINRIHQKIPKFSPDGRRLQMIVCSATLHNFDVKKMADKIMHFPIWVDLKGQDSVPETVHHVVCSVDPRTDTSWQRLQAHVQTDGIHARDRLQAAGSNSPETLSEAVKLLKGEYCVRAIREHRMDKAIIFCRTKVDCDNLEQYFTRMGGGPRQRSHQLSCVCLHGDRRPPERKNNLEMFKRGEVRFLVCTDVAARGLDISGLPFLINMTLPPTDEKTNYVHRIGRVGRAERMGLAINMVSVVPEKVWYHGCPSRGKSCNDTRLTTEGGCAIWYNEQQYLAAIEEHLGVTITQVDTDVKVPADEFDGKVAYGQKRAMNKSEYKGHVDFLAPTVKELAHLEQQAQTSFLTLQHNTWITQH